MEKEQDLSHFLMLKYDVRISERSEGFYAYVPELSLFARAATVAEAYAKLRAEKRKHFTRMIEMGIGDQIPIPASQIRYRTFAKSLIAFGFKAMIVGMVSLILVLVSLPVIDAFVVTRLARMPRTAALAIDRQSQRLVTKLGTMSDVERHERLENLRALIRELKPYYDEFEQLWIEEGPDEGMPELHHQ